MFKLIVHVLLLPLLPVDSSRVEYTYTVEAQSTDPSVLDQTELLIEMRLAAIKTRDFTVEQGVAPDQLFIEANTNGSVRALIEQKGEFSLHHVESDPFILRSIEQKMKMDGQYDLKSHDGETLVLRRSAFITNAHIAMTEAIFDQYGQASVLFELTKTGSHIMADETNDRVGERLAIVIDGEVYSAPTLLSALHGGQFMLNAQLSFEEAETLAAIIGAGPLPADITILSESINGAATSDAIP